MMLSGVSVCGGDKLLHGFFKYDLLKDLGVGGPLGQIALGSQ